VGLANLGSELETCVGSRVRLVGVSISFERSFYRLPFTPPLSGSPYRSFTFAAALAERAVLAHRRLAFHPRMCGLRRGAATTAALIGYWDQGR
jgi:hypothetical protein